MGTLGKIAVIQCFKKTCKQTIKTKHIVTTHRQEETDLAKEPVTNSDRICL